MESSVDFLGKIDAIWVLIAASLVFLMQAGFKCLEVGMVQKKHVETVALKNVIDWCVASLVFFVLGFGLMFGRSHLGILGTNLFFPTSLDSVENGSTLGMVFFMFQLAFVGTSVTIVSGAMSERTGFIPYMTAAIFISLVIYPVFGHWAWGNLFFSDNKSWLADLGFIDFAGSSVVHSIGAWVALAGLTLLGPRIGRFDDNGKPRNIRPYSIPYATLGLLILWFGWWGFNGGSTLAFNASVGHIILNTNIAGATGAIVAYLHCMWFQKKDGIYEKFIGGALGGLVAITASAHLQSPLTSILIGAIAGVVHNLAYEWLLRKKIDDAVGAVPVHGFCGVVGTMLVAIAPEFIASGWAGFFKQLSVQALGVVVCFSWTFGSGYLLFAVLKRTVGLRVSPHEERTGITLFPNAETEREVINEVELEDLLEQIN